MCPGRCLLCVGAIWWSVPGVLCGTSTAVFGRYNTPVLRMSYLVLYPHLFDLCLGVKIDDIQILYIVLQTPPPYAVLPVAGGAAASTALTVGCILLSLLMTFKMTASNANLCRLRSFAASRAWGDGGVKGAGSA